MFPFFYYGFTDIKTYKNALISCDFEKLELIGDEYLWTCVSKYADEQQYKYYVTDCLKAMTEITALMTGNSVEMDRYYDYVYPKPKAHEKTADEVVNDVVRNSGITIIDDSEEVET